MAMSKLTPFSGIMPYLFLIVNISAFHYHQTNLTISNIGNKTHFTNNQPVMLLTGFLMA